MVKMRSFNSLYKYKTMDTKNDNQETIIKDMVSTIRHGNTLNLQGLLEILNTSTDVDVQVKLFSMLSAYLLSNEAQLDVVVSYIPLYDKISKILAKSNPRKMTVTFNFLSALLFVDEDDNHRKKSLVVYAKNMIRNSGCLATMCDLFAGFMMHQDAWRTLCRCLAESCRGIEANQSYCTHLVPMCVQRCSQRNIEVLVVLQSLLENHNRNINLFIKCNGILLFQRHFLQLDICLQLLATIVQSSTEAVNHVVRSNICQQLRDFLDLYGPQTQLGQWATIILYYTTGIKVTCTRPQYTEQKVPVTSESLFGKMNPPTANRDLECTANTSKLFQNVMKEIIQCAALKDDKDFQTFFPSGNKGQRDTVNNSSSFPCLNMSQRNKVWSGRNINKFNLTKKEPIKIQNETNELSFSFLRKQYLSNKHVTGNTADKYPESFQRTLPTNESNARQTTVFQSFVESNRSCLNTVDTNDFNPQFSSTPKIRGKDGTSRFEIERSNKSRRKSRNKSIQRHRIRRHREKMPSNHLEWSKVDKDTKHRSFSGRLFDAINTSCTTLVKTVKNIFKPKGDLHETKEESSNKTSNDRDKQSCSYSFTNYMHKRDAILKNESIEFNYGLVDRKSTEDVEDFSMEMTNSCNTCNDTISLKRKLATDDHLKLTIRKLKLGINLYGCDFKKISRTMWPNESYMTPAVLYNLYRKLIIK